MERHVIYRLYVNKGTACCRHVTGMHERTGIVQCVACMSIMLYLFRIMNSVTASSLVSLRVRSAMDDRIIAENGIVDVGPAHEDPAH